MLMFWYATVTRLELYIRWGADKTSFFTISNGVRQGQTFSPSIFVVYMGVHSSLLNASKVGCHNNNNNNKRFI